MQSRSKLCTLLHKLPSCLEITNTVTFANKSTLTVALRQTWMVKNGFNAPTVRSGIILSAKSTWETMLKSWKTLRRTPKWLQPYHLIRSSMKTKNCLTTAYAAARSGILTNNCLPQLHQPEMPHKIKHHHLTSKPLQNKARQMVQTLDHLQLSVGY